jgi:toxin ParE1/3/4
VTALIEDHPFAGRARNEVRPGLRSFAATPHVIFYRVVNNPPEIVRVLDGRQDIEEILRRRTWSNSSIRGPHRAITLTAA